MNKLIQEISTIVSQYGQDIVTEERFVNILKDLYPDRDHPEKFDILKAIIAEGISADMYTDCNVATAKSFLEKKAGFLSRKHGFETEDVKQVLACLCIGCGFLTLDDYKAAAMSNSPKPSSQKSPNPVKPSPQKHNNDPLDILSLIWAFLGLMATPFVYLGLVTDGWWPSWALGVVIVIHLFTIYLSITQNQKLHANAKIVGGITAITLCSSLFISLAPFIIYWTRDHFNDYYIYYGFSPNENPTVMTFIWGVLIAIFFSSTINKTTNENPYTSRVAYERDKQNVLKGFFATIAIIIAVSSIGFYLPYRDKQNEELMLAKEKEDIEIESKRIAELSEKRQIDQKELSFMGFSLGSDFNELLKRIGNDKDSYTSPFSASRYLMVNQIDYTSIVDTAVYVTTNWDNELVDLCLYASDNRVIAIEIKTNHEIDSLLSIYADKYGDPEYLPSIDYSKYKYHTLSLNEEKDRLRIKDYTWTFKNALIQIKDGRMVESTGHYGNSIIYFDRRASALLNKYNDHKRRERLKQEEIENAAAQRIKDSIKQVVQKERLEKKQNHEKSIKQI